MARPLFADIMRMLNVEFLSCEIGGRGSTELLPYEAHCSEDPRICWRFAGSTLALRQVQILARCYKIGEGIKLWKSR